MKKWGIVLYRKPGYVQWAINVPIGVLVEPGPYQFNSKEEAEDFAKKNYDAWDYEIEVYRPNV